MTQLISCHDGLQCQTIHFGGPKSRDRWYRPSLDRCFPSAMVQAHRSPLWWHLVHHLGALLGNYMQPHVPLSQGMSPSPRSMAGLWIHRLLSLIIARGIPRLNGTMWNYGNPADIHAWAHESIALSTIFVVKWSALCLSQRFRCIIGKSWARPRHAWWIVWYRKIGTWRYQRCIKLLKIFGQQLVNTWLRPSNKYFLLLISPFNPSFLVRFNHSFQRSFEVLLWFSRPFVCLYSLQLPAKVTIMVAMVIGDHSFAVSTLL